MVKNTIVLSCTKSADTSGREDTLKKFRPQRREPIWNKRKDSVPKFPLMKVYVSVMKLLTPSRVSEFKSELGCTYGDKCRFRHEEAAQAQRQKISL